MSTTWILTADPRIGSLVTLARTSARPVTAVTLGEIAVTDVDDVIAISTDGATPVEAYAADVAAAITAEPGDVVLVPDRPAERVLAGAVAAHLAAPLLTGLRTLADSEVEVARYGGITLETISGGPLVLVADGGPAGDGEPVTPGTTIVGTGYPVRVVAETTSEVAEADLASAKRIVAAGRGVKAVDDLGLVRDLAAAMGAEVACSRPLAEGLDWLPKSSYIGVSGKTVKPQVYVAVGISGQLQHMVGAQDSRTVVAINSDPNAPIFAQADYGVVGDLYDVVPALTHALR